MAHNHSSHSHHHDPEHEHSHNHGHAHAHVVPTQFGRAFAIAIALNMGFVVVEFGYGVISNSTALMADAGHNLSDVLGLVIAWAAAVMAKKQPSTKFTYGLGHASILAALFNALFLLVACGAIGWEAIQRFTSPEAVAGLTVSVVAGVGILVNGLSAALFMRGAASDINIRGAYLHMLGDALVSLGVVVAGILMYFTGWQWLDPVMSLVIVAIILVSTWGLFNDAVVLSLAGVPPHINLAEVQQHLLAYPNVSDVYDLHIWSLSTAKVALTAHLVVPQDIPQDLLADIRQDLQDKFQIDHVTIQIESVRSEQAAMQCICK